MADDVSTSVAVIDNIDTDGNGNADWINDELDRGDNQSRKRPRSNTDEETNTSLLTASTADAHTYVSNGPTNDNAVASSVRRKFPKLNPSADGATSSSSSSSPLISLSRSDAAPVFADFLRHFYWSQHHSSASYRPPENAYKQLPGPLPISLTRATLGDIEQTNYWVCEKSDGERSIMFISAARRAAFLIDRKCQVQRINDDQIYVHLYTKNGGDTVLDGELIGTIGSAAITYMIFDTICIDGQRYAELNLWPRLTAMANNVLRPFQEASTLGASNWKRPVIIDMKSFQVKHHIELKIFQRIKQVVSPPSSSSDHHHPQQQHHSPFFPEYIYNDGKRHNKNDGLIFTADDDDYYNKKIPLYKWKWPSLNTVDFVVREPFYDQQNRLRLYANATVMRDATSDLPSMYGGGGGNGDGRDNGVTGDCFVRATPLDAFSAGLIIEIRNRRLRRAVVECGYGLDDGVWHLKNVRWDKSTANFITTVQSTMESIVDNINQKDIIAACIKKPFRPNTQVK